MPVINVTQETFGNTIDSALGYQDSDPSPIKICLPKRKRKVSFTARNKCKNKRLTRRCSYPLLLQEHSSETNNSSYFIPIRRSMSSLNSDVYRSESYQLLKPKEKRPSKKLECIDENNPASAKIDPDIRHFSTVSKDSNKSCDNSGSILEIASSSNVTLPHSPELSVVETMSVSREIIKGANHPTINEVQQNVSTHLMDYSEYIISGMDISVPLMNQRCKLRKSTRGGTSANASKSESVQLKDCTVNLTLSETLDQRLRELLLESTKKSSQEDNKQTPMEVDQTTVPAKKTRARKQKDSTAMDVDETNTTKKTRAKKRSSTPQKKKAVPKSKAPQDPIIEEYVETCSAGRKSCPPVITFIPVDENANHSSDIILNPVKANPKKKKDIIKVKIQRPRKKSSSKESLRGKSVGNGSVVSTCTDSGINDTETISLVLKDSSVDLIHNHSETCLQANECIGNNSVEFVSNSPISIISLSSSRQSEDSEFYRILENAVVLSEDTSNNLDNVGSGPRSSDEVFQSPETKYHSPFTSMNSIITEDLSNSPPTQPTKWYLFDEDVTNAEPASNITSFGSNLKQLFPIACAVPNLSTISEMSKENDDSRKATGTL